MRITTVGKPKNVPIKVCKDAIEFYGKHLLGKRLYEKIDLTLEFDASDLGSTVYGFCDWNDDNHKARDFTIIIHPELNKKTMLTVLAHEMVHVKQYAMGQLDYVERRKLMRWGKDHFNTQKMNYWDYPWEIEAFGRELGLVIMFQDVEHKRKK